MQHPYDVLEKQNAALLAGAYILPNMRAQATHEATALLKNRARYAKVIDLTTVLIPVTAGIHYRECDANFRCCMANGEEIINVDRKTTLVPRGRGPYMDPDGWEKSVKDAFHIDALDSVAATHRWTQESLVYYTNAYNGFGPNDHGKHSGYVWAGTNVYDGGMYVADGRWNPSAHDTRLGTVALMMAIAELAPDLALQRAQPTVTAQTVIARPAPVPDGHGGHPDMPTVTIQHSLNKLGLDPALKEDGNYGRITALAVRSFQQWAGIAADGLCGPQTRAAITAELAKL